MMRRRKIHPIRDRAVSWCRPYGTGILCSAYDEEELEGGDTRTVLHFHPALAPVKIGVLPLSKKAQ